MYQVEFYVDCGRAGEFSWVWSQHATKKAARREVSIQAARARREHADYRVRFVALDSRAYRTMRYVGDRWVVRAGICSAVEAADRIYADPDLYVIEAEQASWYDGKDIPLRGPMPAEVAAYAR